MPSGPACSETNNIVINISLKFQMLISNACICQYFLLKKCEKLLLKSSGILRTLDSASLDAKKIGPDVNNSIPRIPADA